MYRYDIQKKTEIISFIPFIPYLRADYSGDVVCVNNNRIIKPGKVIWHFHSIAPMSSIEISLPLEILFIDHKYYEIDEIKNNKFERDIAFRERKILFQSHYKLIEFAIYTEVELLLDKEAYYYKEFEYNEQSVNYFNLTIPIVENTIARTTNGSSL